MMQQFEFLSRRKDGGNEKVRLANRISALALNEHDRSRGGWNRLAKVGWFVRIFRNRGNEWTKGRGLGVGGRG